MKWRPLNFKYDQLSKLCTKGILSIFLFNFPIPPLAFSFESGTGWDINENMSWKFETFVKSYTFLKLKKC